jgi:hypothetical protein
MRQRVVLGELLAPVSDEACLGGVGVVHYRLRLRSISGAGSRLRADVSRLDARTVGLT